MNKETYSEPEVLVVGAGMAGISASIAAARKGAKTTLVEKLPFPGGLASAANVGTICGLYLRSLDQELEFASEGYPKEFAQRYLKETNSEVFTYSKGLHFIPYKIEELTKHLKTLLKEESINCFFNTSLESVEHSKSKISSLYFSSKNQAITIKPKSVIDTTGLALVSQKANIKTQEEDNPQAAGFVFSLKNTSISNTKTLRLELIKEIIKGIQNNELSTEDEYISILPGPINPEEIYFKLSITPSILTNEKIVLDQYAINRMNKIVNFLKSHFRPFKKSEISYIAPIVGIRTGSRALGEKTLTKEDVITCKKYELELPRGAWPIEFWGEDKKPRMEYFSEKNWYDIPLTCLTSTSFDNLYFAGRCISATSDAIASARVIGTCLDTGYFAGKLAARPK